MNKKILIDLDHPPRVSGLPARFQSLWLLLRILHAQQEGDISVPASAIQARFPGSANLRMLVSRAFRDFSAWGIEIGWGHLRDVPVALLNAASRSKGPFWITAAQARRLRLRVQGKALTHDMLVRFLGLSKTVRSDAVQYLMQDVTYWNHLTQAMRLAQDGMPQSSGVHEAGSFRAAQHSALDDFQRALAMLKESLAWRRHGQVKRSQEALSRLARLLEPPAFGAAMPTLSAMAFVARAWNSYTRGDATQSHAELDRLAADQELEPVIRYNPRVRFEYLNLRALLHRGTALDVKNTGQALRTQAAEQTISALSEALQAAYEADSVEAAQDVAANIGWTLWLCWEQRLLTALQAQDARTVQAQALRWLGLSEWICDRFGVGGSSAWNTVFVLRIARGNCNDRSGNVDRFRAQIPLPVEQMLDATRPFHAPFSRAKGYASWPAVAAFALDEHDAGRVSYGALQVANLLLELTWFSAHEQGLCRQAFTTVERLAHVMRGLTPGQRRFFSDSLRTLPVPLQAAASEAKRHS
jgi:hypothetical protein